MIPDVRFAGNIASLDNLGLKFSSFLICSIRKKHHIVITIIVLMLCTSSYYYDESVK